MDDVTFDLLLARDGDGRAFTRAAQSCDRDIRRFCQWFTHGNHDVDDLAQEVFLRAFKGLSSFRGDSSGRAWFLTIARRACLDHGLLLERDSKLSLRLQDHFNASTPLPSTLHLHELISSLPPDFREAFVMVRVLGFGYSEAALILQCPQGTIQSRVARARIMLSKHLIDEQHAFGTDEGRDEVRPAV